MSDQAIAALVEWSAHTALLTAEVAQLREGYEELRAEVEARKRDRWAFFALGAGLGAALGYALAMI